MNEIIINRELRKFSEGLERQDKDIHTLVIHGAGIVNNSKSLIKWMSDGGIMPDGTKRESDYKKAIALFHYINGRNGQLTETINPHNTVYHSSTGHFDTHTIGVENINGAVDNSNQYTPEQYRSLCELVIFLNKVFKNQIKTIVGHGYAKQHYGNGGTKACPGTGFDWVFFKFCLQDIGYKISDFDMSGRIGIYK